ncbi:glycosyltransferase family 39 protein [Streptomyces albogriseolus]|uniref:glycosyltransferase family 39 protein n=1 Tax=Streptomyces albogriseolus TaxID=1887 RepID=UPI0036E406B6
MSVDTRVPAPAEATASPPPPVRRPSPRPVRSVVVLAPFLLTVVLGLWGIRREDTLWGDEAVTYALAQRDLSQIWHTVQHVDLVHALHYALMHAVFDLFGAGLLTLRLPSVLAMAAAASAVALLGRRLTGSRVGLLAGLVFPLLPQVQKYAQEGRSYALVCALVAWATYALVTGVARHTRGRWALYGGSMLLACLLHEFAVLALVAHGVTLLVSRVPRPVLRGWGVAAAAVVTGLAPLVVRSAAQAEQVAWIEAPVRLPGFALVAVLGLVCAFVPAEGRGRPVRLSALAVPLVALPCLLLLAASLVKPLFVDRYVLYSHVGIALLTGSGAHHVRRLRRSSGNPWITVGVGAAAVAVLAALVPTSLALRAPAGRSNDATAVGAALRETGRPGDGLLYAPALHRYWTEPNPGDTRALTDLALAESPVASHTLAGVELPAPVIAARMLRFDRIVVVHGRAGAHLTGSPQERAKTLTLRRHFRARATTHVNGARIVLYVRDR